MSNEIAIKNDMTYEELLALQGLDTGENNFMPQLKLNALHEDDDGKAIPSGTFKVTLDGTTWYGKTAKVRVFLNKFQYQVYDPDKNEFTNKTIQFSSFREEAIDMKGGTRCGRVTGDPETLSDAQKAINKAAQCYRIIYGRFQIVDAVDADGNKKDIVEFDGMWRARGSNFMPMDGVLKQITKGKKLPIFYWIDLSLKREKQGATVYYVAQPKVDLTQEVGLQEGDNELLSNFHRFVEHDNKEVHEAFRQATKITDMNGKEVYDAVVEDDLNDDLEDL